eukprot:5802307-Amphidinium_carterae.1
MDEHGGMILGLQTAEGKQARDLMNKAWQSDNQRSEPLQRFIPLVQEKGVYNILVKEPNSTAAADASANDTEGNGESRPGGSTGRHGGPPQATTG